MSTNHPEPVSLRQALDAYYDHLRLDNRPATLAVYADTLERLAAALGIATDVRAITPADLNHALLALLRPDLSEATREKYKRTVRTFFRWLVTNDYRDDNPARYSARVVIADPLDTGKAIPEADIDRMLAACRHSRDYALVRVLADTAFRLGGVHNLRVEGIRPDLGTITTVEDKGSGRDRQPTPHTVPLSPETNAALQRWLDERGAIVARLGHEHGYVFVNLFSGTRLTKSGISEILERLGRRAGVKSFSAHRFRHAWGVWAAEAGVPVTEVQAQMGHSSAATTWNYYYRSSLRALRETAARRARRNGNGDGKAGEASKTSREALR